MDCLVKSIRLHSCGPFNGHYKVVERKSTVLIVYKNPASFLKYSPSLHELTASGLVCGSNAVKQVGVITTMATAIGDKMDAAMEAVLAQYRSLFLLYYTIKNDIRFRQKIVSRPHGNR